MSDEPCTCERHFGYTCPQHTESWVAAQLRDPEMARAVVDEFGEELQRASAERDSLATQLDDAREVIVTLRATMEQMRRERDEAWAKLARVRSWAKGGLDAPSRTLACVVLRIIDEKEGGHDE